MTRWTLCSSHVLPEAPNQVVYLTLRDLFSFAIPCLRLILICISRRLVLQWWGNRFSALFTDLFSFQPFLPVSSVCASLETQTSSSQC